jgi:EmrB/QacA subfamily drug resistance transporter
MSLLVVSMDATIVNVALPSIRRELGTSVSGLQWTVDAYTLTVASFLLLSGSTADRIGRRRIFQIGLAIFSLRSLLCSLAPSVGFLVAARVLQGLGGSMLNPVAMSIITNTYTDRKQRARAVGVWGAVSGVSLALGPIVGGVLTQTVGWRGVFWVNIPIGIAAIILTARFVPESRAAKPRKIDPLGQVLVIVALFSLVYGLIEAPSHGWNSPVTIGLFVVAALAVVILIWHELRVRAPMIDVRFFRSFPFSSATVTAVLGFSSFAGFLFLNALYLQDVRGLSALQTGLYMLPLALATLLFSLLSGRLVARFGTRPSLIFAGLGIATSAVTMTFLTAQTPEAMLLVSYVIFGIGMGFLNAPITTAAVSGMPLSQAGVAAGLASTSRQVGNAVGVALAGLVTGVGTATVIGASFAIASHALWWIIAGAGLTIVLIGIVSATTWSRRTADSVRDLFEDGDGKPTRSIPTVALDAQVAK